MSNFNWLHLTDLHWGLNGQDALWPNIRKEFYINLKKMHDRSGPWNVVFFSGDLVQEGSPSQYHQLQEMVLDHLFEYLRSLGSGDAVFLAVPGNHDLRRPKGKGKFSTLKLLFDPKLKLLLDPDAYHKYSQDLFTDKSSVYRRKIEDAFCDYSRWWDNIIERNYEISIDKGILPGDFSTTVPVAGGRQVGVVGLNTAYLQLAPGDYKEKLAIHPAQLNEVCHGDAPSWIEKHDLCILITHHGPDWLNPKLSGQEYSEINPAGRFAVHLFGHMHEGHAETYSHLGGPPVRLLQASSLFGMEKYGEPPILNRRHGYSTGRIEFQKDKATIRHWPQLAVNNKVNGWRFKRDDGKDRYTLDDDGGTTPKDVQYSNRLRNESPADRIADILKTEHDVLVQRRHEVYLFHTSDDVEFVSHLEEELQCFGCEPIVCDITKYSNLSVYLKQNLQSFRSFCFIISSGFDRDENCVSTVADIRNEFSNEKSFSLLVNISESQCVDSDYTFTLKETLGGITRREIINLAGKIDALGRELPKPYPPIHERRDIFFSPNPFTTLLNQDDLRITRWESLKNLYEMLQTHRVVAISGMPSSGRSALAIDLMMNLSMCESDRSRWPLTIIGTHECDGTVPDLVRLCSIVFEVLGPPPASGADDPAMALTLLLDECKTWLLLDQFETAMTIDGHCKDPSIAKFLKIADEKLEHGRVIVTSNTPGIVMDVGRRCVNHESEWTNPELSQLVDHISMTMKVSPPLGLNFENLQRWATGNPYLMILAVREWCAIGALPEVQHTQLEPYKKVGHFIESANKYGLLILQILNLITTFSASVSLIRRTIYLLRRQSLELNLPENFNVQFEIDKLVRMGLIKKKQDNTQRNCYQLHGLVGSCLNDQYPLESTLKHSLGISLANCILEEQDYINTCYEVVGPAIYDGESWQWSGVPAHEVGCAVRAADVLLSTDEAVYAVDLLMGEENETLKSFNRLAPASVRSNFYSRMSTLVSDSVSYHESIRGFALARADTADFKSAVDLLDNAMEALDEANEVISHSDLHNFKAKNLDLRAYCQRHIEDQLDSSVYTYKKALELMELCEVKDERCKLLRGLGNSMIAKKNWEKAKLYFDDSYNVALKLPNKHRLFNIGRINCDLAILQVLTGEPGEAKKTCKKGINAMRENDDFWNERIAFMNLCGIELALTFDTVRAEEHIKALLRDFVRIENVLALQVLRKNSENLSSASELSKVCEWWEFVELT